MDLGRDAPIASASRAASRDAARSSALAGSAAAAAATAAASQSSRGLPAPPLLDDVIERTSAWSALGHASELDPGASAAHTRRSQGAAAGAPASSSTRETASTPPSTASSTASPMPALTAQCRAVRAILEPGERRS